MFADDVKVQPARRARWAQLAFAWQHRFRPEWSSDASAGPIFVQVPGVRGDFAALAANAALTWPRWS